MHPSRTAKKTIGYDAFKQGKEQMLVHGILRRLRETRYYFSNSNARACTYQRGNPYSKTANHYQFVFRIVIAQNIFTGTTPKG